MDTTKMVCPVCHNELPHSVGEVEDCSIALIGAKDAGKSIYIGALIHEINQRIGLNLNASLVALNEQTLQRYRQDFYTPLYQDKHVIATTISATAEMKHPLMYRFSIKTKGKFGQQKQRVVSLVFFDTAGEDLKDIDVMRREIKYISNSSGIIFLLDPLQIPAVRDQLPAGTVIPDIYTQPDDIVMRVIKLIREDRQIPETKPIDIPVSLAFSKIDALRTILAPDSKLNAASVHGSGFNVADHEMVHNEMGAYIQSWIGSNLTTTMDHNFNQYGFFGCSALGSSPTSDGNLTDSVSSYRIEDPFLWLLWKNGLIEGQKKGKRR
jgi:GTPase SAR1 family protein